MNEKEKQQYIFGYIFLLANKLQILGDQLTGEITLKQWFLLNMIRNMENKFPNFNDIADVMGTSRQNVSKTISVLEKKGMVTLHPSPKDQRSIYVELTEESHKYFQNKEDTGNLFLDQIFSGIDEKEIETTMSVRMQMMKNAEDKLESKNQENQD
ncbi:MAG TPA: MarR family transcriptional regulator [Clostridiaceae bacterium]|nr:MarR family transcriptional regulator [Clostridiaceae bacterium]